VKGRRDESGTVVHRPDKANTVHPSALR
jgi:hypothetical protein